VCLLGCFGELGVFVLRHVQPLACEDEAMMLTSVFKCSPMYDGAAPVYACMWSCPEVLRRLWCGCETRERQAGAGVPPGAAR